MSQGSQLYGNRHPVFPQHLEAVLGMAKEDIVGAANVDDVTLPHAVRACPAALNRC